VTLTRVGSTVTATTVEPHNYGDGTDITISGAVEPEYNGTWPIVRTGATTFTYDIGAAPATPATGTILSLLAIRSDMLLPLTRDRTRLKRLGVGRVTQLTFINDEVDQAIEIRGYEVNPVEVLGRR